MAGIPMTAALRRRLAAAAACLFLACGSAATAAAADGAADADALLPSGWRFHAAPYLWAAGLDGSMGLFGLPPQDVSLGFRDVVQDLDMAFMGAFGARHGRLSVTGDLTYVDVSSTVETPVGLLANSIDTGSRTVMGSLLGGYTFVAEGQTALDLVAGARLWHVDMRFDVNGGPLGGRALSEGDTWLDPVAGFSGRSALGDGFRLAGWALVGGFGIGSHSMWDVMAGLGYDLTGSIELFGGWRAVGVDYSSDGFDYDVVQHGPLLGGAIRF